MRLLEHSPWVRYVKDAFDIFLVALLIYSVLRLIRGTRTVNMLVGLGMSILVYYISSVAELYTLNWILFHGLESLLLIVVIIFQNEIRRFLTRMGQTSFSALLSPVHDDKSVDEIVRASVSMANKRIGALIVIEKESGLNDYIETGVNIDAAVSKELLVALFLSSSPIHDGAVMVQKGRLSYASCFLPLSMNPDLDPELGTRHRAAIGLTEESDALVIVVSEEKGWISVAMNGKIIRGVDEESLRKMLHDQLKMKTPELTQLNINFHSESETKEHVE